MSLDWDRIYREVLRRFDQAEVTMGQLPEDSLFRIEAACWPYPPRIYFYVWVPTVDQRRKEEYSGDTIGKGGVRAELSDEELQAVSSYIVKWCEAAGSGLRVRRCGSNDGGVLEYEIKPKDYGKWSEGDFK